MLGVEDESIPHLPQQDSDGCAATESECSLVQTPMDVQQLTAVVLVQFRMQGQHAMMLLLQAPATFAPAAPVGLKSSASVKVVLFLALHFHIVTWRYFGSPAPPFC